MEIRRFAVVVRHTLLSKSDANMAGEWEWRLDLTRQGDGRYRASLRCHGYEPPMPPGAAYRFKRGDALWEWLSRTWEETVGEPFDYADSLFIACELLKIDPSMAAQFKESALFTWVQEALEEHECLQPIPDPDRDRKASILEKATWLDPISGGGGAGQGMAHAVRMAAVSQFIDNYLAQGIDIPAGEHYLDMEGGPEGSGKEFVAPYVGGTVSVSGRFRIDPYVDTARSVAPAKHKEIVVRIQVTANGEPLAGYPMQRQFDSRARAYRFYSKQQVQAVRHFVTRIGSARDLDLSISKPALEKCELSMWVMGDETTEEDAPSAGGVALRWQADDNVLGSLEEVGIEE
jgi:hypothetical protein